MRLYLSSYRLGAATGELLRLMRGRRRVGIIANALDFIPMADRRAHARNVYDPVAAFAALGLEARYLDLRHWFDDPEGLDEALLACDLLWAMGGNSFLLRRAMRQSGFDRLIGPLLAEDRLVYGGFSAGAVVAGPSLAGIEIVDPPLDLAEGYDPAVISEGLGLVDAIIVPHYRSDHPEAAAVEKVAALLAERKVPHITLSDGEVLVHDGGALRRAGRPAKGLP